ncbi:MAG: halocyanin domain-containing protein [Haloarculaceae archaeon]
MATATVLGAASGLAAGASSGPDYGGWFGDDTGGAVDNYDGTTVDKTGQDSVTIEVGADGNGGTYAFAPPAVRIDPGTEVTFEWVSNTHNVKIEDKPDGSDWSGESAVKNEGYTYSHTFETEGVYKYYCEPHLALGMKGAIVVGGSGGGGGGPDWGEWFTDAAQGGAVGNYDGSTVDRTGQDEVTVKVGSQGNGGSYAYSPPALQIDPGTKVTFEWVSDTHNIVVAEKPDSSGWSGESAIKNKGYTYEHTFEASGTYKYYCDPHLALGMKGGIYVTGNATGSGGGGGAPVDWGKTLTVIGPSVAVFIGVLGYLAWGYHELGEEAGPSEPPVAVEAPEREPTTEISHDEYDPWGTATLIAAYLAILVIAWTLMYFVEFLGHGPHILG